MHMLVVVAEALLLHMDCNKADVPCMQLQLMVMSVMEESLMLCMLLPCRRWRQRGTRP